MDNDVVKTSVYDKLVAKVNAIDTSGFVLRTQYNTGKLGIVKEINDADKKIPNTGELVQKKLIIMQKLLR